MQERPAGDAGAAVHLLRGGGCVANVDEGVDGRVEDERTGGRGAFGLRTTTWGSGGLGHISDDSTNSPDCL